MKLTDATIKQYATELGLDGDVLKSVLDVRPDGLFLTAQQEFILDAIALAKGFGYAPVKAMAAAERLYKANGMTERPPFDKPYLQHADIIAITEYAVLTGGRVMEDDTADTTLKEFHENWNREVVADFGADIYHLPKEYRDAVIQETARSIAKWNGPEAYEPSLVTASLLWHLIGESLERIWDRFMDLPAPGSFNHDLDRNILDVFARRHAGEFYGKYGIRFEDASEDQRRTVVSAVRDDLKAAGLDPVSRATVLDIQRVMTGPASSIWWNLSQLKSREGKKP